jgi:hypothetical protein
MDDPSENIQNSDLLVSKLGYWPSFHDAEVFGLSLSRDGRVLRVSIYVFTTPGTVDERGYFVLENRCVVTLAFRGIREFDIGGFNEQNVLQSIRFTKSDEGLHVELYPLYGLGGVFDCDTAEVEAIESP